MGLRDPLSTSRGCARSLPDAWIVGEKILEPGEFLRAVVAHRWDITGMTFSMLQTVCW